MTTSELTFIEPRRTPKEKIIILESFLDYFFSICLVPVVLFIFFVKPVTLILHSIYSRLQNTFWLMRSHLNVYQKSSDSYPFPVLFLPLSDDCVESGNRYRG